MSDFPVDPHEFYATAETEMGHAIAICQCGASSPWMNTEPDAEAWHYRHHEETTR